MSFTYELSTNRGRVRLLISDTQESRPIFTDDEIDAFLAIAGSEYVIAAATALDVIATNEALTQKVITVLDLKTDGAALAEAMRAHAKQLRADHAARSEDVSTAFDTAEFADGVFAEEERLYKQSLRLAI